MPWGIIGEILFDLLCAKVEFIMRWYICFLYCVSSVIPAVNWVKWTKSLNKIDQKMLKGGRIYVKLSKKKFKVFFTSITP